MSRTGKVLAKASPDIYDHDYAHLSEGKVVPAGLYDMKRNKGYVSIGIKHLGIRVVVVHYPPYCSKWNPIEHRLFSQMHRQADGCVFYSHEQVKKIFEATTTKTGLKVFVRINAKQYEKGLGITKEQVDEKRILYHSELPQFNYTILP